VKLSPNTPRSEISKLELLASSYGQVSQDRSRFTGAEIVLVLTVAGAAFDATKKLVELIKAIRDWANRSSSAPAEVKVGGQIRDIKNASDEEIESWITS
jgi:hypothetical protein